MMMMMMIIIIIIIIIIADSDGGMVFAWCVHTFQTVLVISDLFSFFIISKMIYLTFMFSVFSSIWKRQGIIIHYFIIINHVQYIKTCLMSSLRV